jgi:(1->4)-alpha-D-glucan 1-alpha-D-glucosylmutase
MSGGILSNNALLASDFSQGRSPSLAPIPSSTYRLQVNSSFTLDDVAELLGYLQELGVGAVYLAPILKSRSGSMHGYDTVDHTRLNPELGTDETANRLAEGLRAAGMGAIIDVVPNHMCIADEANWRWRDVLENGPSSPQAKFFDIDWIPPRVDLAYKILLPILGNQFGLVLENQEIQVEYAEGAFHVRYWESTFPAAPRSWPIVLTLMLADLRQRIGDDHRVIAELESIITAIGYLPLRTETDADRIQERQREKTVIKSRLSTLLQVSAEAQAALKRSLVRLNGTKGQPDSFDILERFLAEQAYRLSYWRVAADEINYRRFFDINELAAIRVEHPAVFDAVHEKLIEGIRAGWITGLRVDHPDGLYDPVLYFDRLQEVCRMAAADAGAIDGLAGQDRPFYIVAEKIMLGDERPRRTWAVHGTTGYGFLNELNGLFVDPAAAKPLTLIYESFTGSQTRFEDLIYQCKRLILRVSMSSELNVLSRQLDRICQVHRHTRDFTLDSLRFALREIISCFPVYRTYIREGQSHVDMEDRRHIDSAIAAARQRNPASSNSVFEAIRQILLLEDPPEITPEALAERRLFVMRFQQLTGPVMAKGVEDTAFYRRYPLASLNEVGGDPALFGLEPDEFHRRIMQRKRFWPHNLVATSTHDTKRSEDVRARLNVLSEIPDEWAASIHRWNSLNRGLRAKVWDMDVPDRNAEYLLYQTIVGILPLTPLFENDTHSEFVSRIKAYMQKALREAKVHTSWINPEPEYDEAVERFVEAILQPSAENQFLTDITRFTHSIARAGFLNAISQTAIKLTSPGVPDIYQGSELWDFSLVDPDNRRRVDYVRRRALLEEINSKGGRSLLEEFKAHPEDDRLKLFVTKQLLRYRFDNQEFFRDAEYVPMHSFGDQRNHVIAFARTTADRILVTVASRFHIALGCRTRPPLGDEVWQDSAVVIPNDRADLQVRDLFTGRVLTPTIYRQRTLLPLSEVFADLPVAVLVTEAS